MSWSNYQKERICGKGANGLAILCKRKKDNALVVVKQVFGMDVLTSDDALNEIQLLSILRHPNIISYFDSFTAPIKEEYEIMEEDDSEDAKLPAANHVLRNRAASNTKANVPLALHIVMEYANGGTLEEYLSTVTDFIDEKEVLYLFSQIIFALHHVHSHHILHRDLKTGNIFITRNGSRIILKVADFGISKLRSQEKKSEAIVGTPMYLSPELCEGKECSEKSDIWATGCILFEIMFRRKMFEASNLPAMVIKITKGQHQPIPADHPYSMELLSCFFSCMQLDASKRPTTSQLMGLVFLQEPLLDTQFSIGRILETDEPVFL